MKYREKEHSGKDALAAFILALFIMVLEAYTLSKTWNWHLVTALGVPEISAKGAYGITLAASLFMHSSCESDKSLTKRMLTKGFTVLIILFVSYIAYLLFY